MILYLQNLQWGMYQAGTGKHYLLLFLTTQEEELLVDPSVCSCCSVYHLLFLCIMSKDIIFPWVSLGWIYWQKKKLCRYNSE